MGKPTTSRKVGLPSGERIAAGKAFLLIEHFLLILAAVMALIAAGSEFPSINARSSPWPISS